jgi:anti-sigma factor RsiW
MHCSSFEPLLAAYLDGELPPALGARLAEHLRTCVSCTELLAELRAIDGLLLAPRQLEPAPNFTFKVMADVRPLPAPRAHRSEHFAVLGAYVVFAWVAIGAFLMFDGNAARAMLATLGAGLARGATMFVALSSTTGHLFGRQTFDVTAAMGAVIALDLVFAACVVTLYAVLRARRAAIDGGSEPC